MWSCRTALTAVIQMYITDLGRLNTLISELLLLEPQTPRIMLEELVRGTRLPLLRFVLANLTATSAIRVKQLHMHLEDILTRCTT